MTESAFRNPLKNNKGAPTGTPLFVFRLFLESLGSKTKSLGWQHYLIVNHSPQPITT